MGGSGEPSRLGSVAPTHPLGGGATKGWTADCVSWNHPASPRTDPSPDLQPWLEGSWASELEKRKDLFLIVLLSPQSETVCVNLEMGDQKAGLWWDILVLFSLTISVSPSVQSQRIYPKKEIWSVTGR